MDSVPFQLLILLNGVKGWNVIYPSKILNNYIHRLISPSLYYHWTIIPVGFRVSGNGIELFVPFNKNGY